MTDAQLRVLLETMLGEFADVLVMARQAMPTDAPRHEYVDYFGMQHAGDFMAMLPLNGLYDAWQRRINMLENKATE